MISIHTQGSGLGRAIPLLRRMGVTSVVAIDPSGDDAHDARLAGITDLIVRHYQGQYDFDTQGAIDAKIAIGVPPGIAAREFVLECSQQAWWPSATTVMVPPAMANADSPPDKLAWVVAFQGWVYVELRDFGRDCIVCNVPTNNNGFFVPSPHFRYPHPARYAGQSYRWPGGNSGFAQHREWMPAVRALVPDATFELLECGFTYLQWPDPRPPAVKPDDVPLELWRGDDVGYRGGYGIAAIPTGDATAMLSADLAELRKDSYFRGAYYYGVGMNSDWSTHDALGDTEFEDWLVAQGAPGPQPEEDGMAEYVTGQGIMDKAASLGATVTGAQLTGEIYLKDGQGKDTYSYAVFEKCEIRYYPDINLTVAIPFLA